MMLQAFQKVFRKPVYAVLALVISALVFVVAVWLPNIRLVAEIVSSPDVSFVNKIQLPLSLLGSIGTNFTIFSASYTIVIVILFGIYVSMLVYFIKNRAHDISQNGVVTGTFGVISGVIGAGCGACGAFLLTSILSLFGIAGIISYLPLSGGEFGIMGVVLLLASIYLVAKKIILPQVCIINS